MPASYTFCGYDTGGMPASYTLCGYDADLILASYTSYGYDAGGMPASYTPHPGWHISSFGLTDSSSRMEKS